MCIPPVHSFFPPVPWISLGFDSSFLETMAVELVNQNREKMINPANQMFQSLMVDAGATAKLELDKAGPPSGLGLYATEALKEGEVILTVPLEHCIVEPRELPPHVARQAGRVPDSFTWDVRLAVKVLEASLGRYGPSHACALFVISVLFLCSRSRISSSRCPASL